MGISGLERANKPPPFGRCEPPRDEAAYRHAEGNSDSDVKTSLFGPGLTLLVSGSRLVLGRWQGVYLAEWDSPRTRTVRARVVGAG